MPPLLSQILEAEMRFSKCAQSATTLFLFAIALAAPAHAQNNKQIISGTFYEDQATLPSTAAGIATLTFTQTPANKFLNITNVACDVFVSATQVLTLMRLQVGTNPGASDLGRSYPIKNTPSAPEIIQNGKLYSVVTNEVFFKMGPGRFPSIFIVAASNGGALSMAPNCFIVGNLTDD
jgi:hypothetical protein